MKYQIRVPIGEGTSKLKDELFLGIVCNWREFCFYLKSKNIFLQPTYFSLFGLFNIQRLGSPCPVTDRDLGIQLRELTEGGIYGDPHHFSKASNFSFDGGNLRIVDYGHAATQMIVVNYGIKIYNDFDPNYDWDKEKRKKRS